MFAWGPHKGSVKDITLVNARHVNWLQSWRKCPSRKPLRFLTTQQPGVANVQFVTASQLCSLGLAVTQHLSSSAVPISDSLRLYLKFCSISYLISTSAHVSPIYLGLVYCLQGKMCKNISQLPEHLSHGSVLAHFANHEKICSIPMKWLQSESRPCRAGMSLVTVGPSSRALSAQWGSALLPAGGKCHHVHMERSGVLSCRVINILLAIYGLPFLLPTVLRHGTKLKKQSSHPVFQLDTMEQIPRG